MTRSEFQWIYYITLSHSVLGLYIILIELSKSQVFSGAKWPPYSPEMNFSWNQQASTSVLVPQIHSPQTRLTVQKGDTINLPCRVHNLGDNQILWRFGTNVLAGSNISTYTDERMQLLPDYSLRISKITEEDQGNYECIVTSWPSVSVVHAVVVHDPPSISLLTPTNIVLTEGEQIEIGCIPHGTPTPKIHWSMRDGKIPLPRTSLNQPKLLLENVSKRHTGLYVCTADNGVGRPAIGAVYVRVFYAPQVEIPKRRVHGGLVHKSTLTAIVHADPKAEVNWRIGQDLVTFTDRICAESNGNEYRLVFNSAKPQDFVTYTIEANNSLGYDVRHIEFSGVPDQPKIARWETEVWRNRISEGVMLFDIEVTLYWAVESYSPVIDYKLHFREAPIPDINSFNEDQSPPWQELTIPADQSSGSFLHTKSFSLRGLRNSTIFEAAIKARNKYGWSHMSVVCYFGTFPDSSNSKMKHMEELMTRLNGSEFSDLKETKDSESSATIRIIGSTYLSVLIICQTALIGYSNRPQPSYF